MDNQALLPLGSVVQLKHLPVRLLIVGYGHRNERGELCRYCGASYPVGVTNAPDMILFQPDEIERVAFRQTESAEAVSFRESIETVFAAK